MNIRKLREEDFDEDAARSPIFMANKVKRRSWVIDFWVAYDIRQAVKSIHLNRYRNNPAARRAILDLREAADKAMRILYRDQGKR